MGPDVLYPTTMGILLVFSGMVSGSETAFFSLPPSQLEGLRQSRTDQLTLTLLRLADYPRRLLLTILLLNNIINISYFALASAWAIHHAQDDTLFFTIQLGSLLGLIFGGEIMPKVLANSQPIGYARMLALPMFVLSIAMAPLCRLTEFVFGRVLGDETEEDSTATAVSGDELKLIVEQSRDQGIVSEAAHDRLLEVIDLSETTARSVMTHRTDCTTLAPKAKHDEIVEALRERPAPIALVMNETDDCVGLLHAQDVLRGGRAAKRMRKPLCIPANATVAQSLELFQHSRRNAGIVVDEYGGTLGLLTLAHIGDELLGPGDNVDLPERPQAKQVDDDRWELPGEMPLAAWDILLAEEDTSGCTTIAGFITKMLGSIPQRGDRLLYGNLLFQVVELEGRRIRTITVEKVPEREARRMTRNMGRNGGER